MFKASLKYFLLGVKDWKQCISLEQFLMALKISPFAVFTNGSNKTNISVFVIGGANDHTI